MCEMSDADDYPIVRPETLKVYLWIHTIFHEAALISFLLQYLCCGANDYLIVRPETLKLICG
jgi:hypothetical protein